MRRGRPTGLRRKSTSRGKRGLQQRIHRLVAKYQHALGLGNWDINVTFGPCTDDAIAQVNHTFRIREATLTFDLEKQQGRSPRLLEHDVIHELAHCITARQEHLMRLLWDELADDVSEDLAVQFERMPLTNRRQPVTVPLSRQYRPPRHPRGAMR